MMRWLGLAAVVVGVDQWVKALIVDHFAYGDERPVLPVFSIVRWHNEGAAFSMLSSAGGWQRWFFAALAIAFAFFIIWELRRLPAEQRIMGWVYGLILGGAIGNLIDRVLHGYVVDFVLLHWGSWYFPAFNVADAALSVGAALWIGTMIVDWVRQRRQAGTS
jgi:signal peptidase II